MIDRFGPNNGLYQDESIRKNVPEVRKNGKVYHVTSIVENESRLVWFYLDQICIIQCEEVFNWKLGMDIL